MLSQQPTQGLGTTSLGFGQQPQTGGLLGQTSFGQPSLQQQTQGFGFGGGQQQQQAPMFGQFQNQQQPAFGQQQGLQTQGQLSFGQTQQPQQQQSFGFLGSNTQMQQQQPQQQSMFGQQQPSTFQSATPTFGAQQPMTAFGQPQQQQQSQQQQIMVPGGQDDSVNDFELDQNSKLEDTITGIIWGQANNLAPNTLLATCGWDGKARIFEIVQQNTYGKVVRNLVERKQIQVDGNINNIPNPILCMDAKLDLSVLFVGTAFDFRVKAIDTQSGQIQQIGQHSACVIAVFWIEAHKMILSVSQDQTMKLWDLGAPQYPKYQLSFTYKPLCADFNYPLLLLGFAQEKIGIININELTVIRQATYLDSPLGQFSQITSIQIFRGKDGFGIGSLDGRGHLTHFTVKSNPSGISEYVLKSIMTFKAHKVQLSIFQVEDSARGKSQSYFFPVNSLQFNPKNHQFLLTAGGEGQMIFWDIQVRNKIKTFQFNNNPVVFSRMSPDGQYLAYALGNDFSKGPEFADQFPNKLCVHFVPDTELRCANSR